jgi:hypothetical protein
MYTVVEPLKTGFRLTRTGSHSLLTCAPTLLEGGQLPVAIPGRVSNVVLTIMARRNSRACVSLAALLLCAACTSVSSTASPSTAPASVSADVSALPSPGVLASELPSALPTTIEVPSDTPTTIPVDTPTPNATPTANATPTESPTLKPTAAARPNLVITRFDKDPGSILVEQPFGYSVTVRNVGNADSGPSEGAVQENNSDDGVKGPFDPFDVPALKVGKSTTVDISVTLPKEGNWKLTAIADWKEAIDESNEKDNSRDLDVKVVSGLPDFAWFKDGLSVFDKFDVTADGHKIELEATFQNVGTAIYSSSLISISVKWYRDEDSASGDLTPFSYGDDLEPGTQVTLSKIDYLPGPGTYKFYAYLDDGRVIDELSEDNNETSADLTIN